MSIDTKEERRSVRTEFRNTPTFGGHRHEGGSGRRDWDKTAKETKTKKSNENMSEAKRRKYLSQ